MQDSPIVWPNWIQTAFGWLASAIAGGAIVRAYTAWLNRHRPAAETHLTQATATEVTVRAGSSASDAMMRMMDRLDAAQITIDRLRSERDEARMKYDLQEIDMKLLNYQMERANYFIKAKGWSLTELDAPHDKPPQP